MSILLDRREDGSLAFFLDGDLQFDSRDEHIYHECLVLPALALAEARNQNPLRALIIGGGDGLSARELLKSKQVEHVDLVDFDPKILQLARDEFSPFNRNSMKDQRLTVSVEDARIFIKRAVAAGVIYDIIISDFSAPHDAEGAQLHMIEFYDAVRNLLGSNGVLAVNSASPSGTPEAYWSIFNSVLASQLNPRAYRISLPSFAEQGYGADWGFIIASPKLIISDDFDSKTQFAQPSQYLTDVSILKDLFNFPESIFLKQASSAAGRGKSDILVHYLFNPNSAIESANETNIESSRNLLEGSEELTLADSQTETHNTESLINTLNIRIEDLKAPEPESASYLLPADLRKALSNWQTVPGEQEALIERVFELMPALHQTQTREMVSDFLEKPSKYLESINLPELVGELLKRASELPNKLREELLFLKDKIHEHSNDHQRLLDLGLRSLAVVILVIVIGNIMYPDSVYAKGTGDHAGHGAASVGRAHDSVTGSRGFDRGNRGGYGYNNNGWTNNRVVNDRVINDRVINDRVINDKVINDKVIRRPGPGHKTQPGNPLPNQ